MDSFSFRSWQRAAGLAIILLAVAGFHPVSAQTVTDPRTLEFSPSPDHNTILSTGLPAVDHYSVSFYYQGASAPFQTNALGKPTPGTNGLIRVDLASSVSNWPFAGGSIDEARVSAVGPGGAGQSTLSNPFTFSASCTYALSATAVSVASAAGTGSFAVNTGSSCSWSAASSASWITVTLGSSMTGTGFVNFSVTANTSSSSRSGTITVAGQTVNVTQAGTSCSYSLNTSALTLASAAGTGSVGVTAGLGCSWTAISNASWLTINGGSSGGGNGTVTFSATANASTSSRTAVLTIAGQTVTVTQQAASSSTTPAVLLSSTYDGGNNDDYNQTVTRDSNGNMYLVGGTKSGTTFPSTIGTCDVSEDAVVTKFSSTGALAWARCLGGSAKDYIHSVAVDDVGAVYVSGVTWSSNLGATSGAYQTVRRGTKDDFVAKLSASGAVQWLTYLGGSGDEHDRSGIFVDGQHNVWVVGTTASTDFPTTAGVYQRSLRGVEDGYVVKLAPDGRSILASTYLGGSGADRLISGIAVHTDGTVYIGGLTNSIDFPTTTGAYQPTYRGGANDGVVARLSATLSSLVFSTYLGGSGEDWISENHGFTVDAAGRAILTGMTWSTDFPVSAAAMQKASKGGLETFVAVLSADGRSLPSSTYLGGSGEEVNTGVSYDDLGNIYVAGETVSPDFPVSADALQRTLRTSGMKDATVTKFAPDLSRVVFSTYFGGSNVDRARGLAVDRRTGKIVVSGDSYSTDFPTTSSAYQKTLKGGKDYVLFSLQPGSATTPGCTYSPSPTAISTPATGGSFSVALSVSASTCTWTTASSQTWATVTPASGTGNASLTVNVAPNGSGSVRTATVTVGGQTISVNQAAASSCGYTLSTNTVSLPAGVSTAVVGVTTTSTCSWTAASGATWLTVTSGSTGTGNGSVAVAATANTSTTPRSATLTIAGQPVTVTQAAASCSYTLSTSAIAVGATASTATVTVSAPAGCTWTATGGNTWVSITAGSSGTGIGTVTVAVTANSTTSTRTATLTVAGKPVTVTQAAASCSYTLSTSAIAVGATPSTASVTVGAPAGCTWTATGGNTWVSITAGSSGTGIGTVTVAVTANSTTSTRTATLTVAGKPVTVTQAAASCSYTLSTSAIAVGATPSTASVTVGAPAGCTWTATGGNTWVSITAGSSGTGNGTVTVAVTANSTTSTRTATLTIAGKSVTVTQAASSCSYTLSTTVLTVGATATSTSVTVNAPAGCAWTAKSNAAWITVTGGSSITGAGTVTISVSANSSASSRTGTLTVGGQTVTVNQAGASCTYTLSTTVLSMGAGGGSASIGITSLSGCSWTAVSSAAWLTVTGGNSGSGNGTVTVAAAANSSTSSRSATVAIGGKLVTVTQSGTACTYSLSAASQSFPSTGGIGSVGLTASGTQCTWTATSTSYWLTLASVASGTGSGTVAYTVAPNATSSTVTGSVSIAGLTYTVTVAAAASTSPTVVKVRSESQLQAAVQALVSNTTIELAAGTYTLTRTLALNGPLQDVTLRGSTNNPADVVLVGGGLNNAAGAAPEALVTTGAVQSLTIANLTIRDVYRHAVHLGPGAEAPRLSNLRLLNAGQAFVRADADPTAGGVSDGVVQGTAFERTQVGRDAVTTAIDVRGGANWRIAANVFRNLVAPAGQIGSPAVLMTGGASNTIAEGNTLINCQRGIAFGWTNADRYDHVGGIIRNNFIYRATGWAGEAAILVVDSPGTEVLQNTAFLSGTYPTPIEYRYPDTAGVIIANNLLDGTVWARDGAMGQDTNNDGTATTAYFVAAAAGDLHLVPGSPAIDRAAPVQDAMTDWDGDSRPMGGAADMGADEATLPNRAPTVTLVAPTNGASVSTPGTIQVTANAADPDGRVVKVDFYANGTLIGTADGGAFSISWRAPKQSGSVRLTAVATDDRGARTTSAAVTITATRKGQ